MRLPSSPDKWKAIAAEGYHRWFFPTYFGARDGKHVAIFKLKPSVSVIYNCKGFFNVFAEYDYQLLAADVGVQARISDGSCCKISQRNSP